MVSTSCGSCGLWNPGPSINQFFARSHVPSQGKPAVIHPIAKVDKPSAPADFRPISIVPVLFRLVERELVHNYLYESFDDPEIYPLLADQFAFRPTGSTTTAIISILQTVTSMLKTEETVTIISLDFSKAFDTVKHSTLVKK